MSPGIWAQVEPETTTGSFGSHIISSLQALWARPAAHAAELVMFALISDVYPPGAYIDRLGTVHDLLRPTDDNESLSENSSTLSPAEEQRVLRCFSSF